MRFVALGLLPSHRISARPLTRREFAAVVRHLQEQPATALSDANRELLARLVAEFLPEAPPRPVLGMEIRGGVGGEPSLTTHPDHRPGWMVLGAMSFGVGRVAFDAEAGHPSPGLQQAVASTRLGTVNVHLGRHALWWGFGDRAALLISDSAGPIDQLRLSVERAQLRYTKFAATLDQPGRYLFGTRVDYQVTPRFRLGLSEAAVAFPSGFLWYHFVNLIPIVLTNGLDIWNRQAQYGANDNFLVAIDFDWLYRPGLLLYGEGMVDDMLVRTPAGVTAPARLAFLGGAYLADPFRTGRTDLRLEYARVYNWTYSHFTPNRSYDLRGRPLGHWLGPDGDDLSLTLTHWTSAEERWTGWLALTRHGEGRLRVVWTSSDEAWQNSFLSGVVETRASLGAGWEGTLGGGALGVSLEIAHVRNRNNVPGDDGFGYLLGLRYRRTW